MKLCYHKKYSQENNMAEHQTEDRFGHLRTTITLEPG
jgi:hypothetical protein